MANYSKFVNPVKFDCFLDSLINKILSTLLQFWYFHYLSVSSSQSIETSFEAVSFTSNVWTCFIKYFSDFIYILIKTLTLLSTTLFIDFYNFCTFVVIIKQIYFWIETIKLIVFFLLVIFWKLKLRAVGVGS